MSLYVGRRFRVQILCRLNAVGIVDFDAACNCNRFGFDDIDDVDSFRRNDVDQINDVDPVLVTVVAILFWTISDVDVSCAFGLGVVDQFDFVNWVLRRVDLGFELPNNDPVNNIVPEIFFFQFGSAGDDRNVDAEGCQELLS